MTDARDELKTSTTLNFFSNPKTLKFPVLAYSKITRFVQDFVPKIVLVNLSNYQKAETTLKKNLHCIFIFFGADFDD